MPLSAYFKNNPNRNVGIFFAPCYNEIMIEFPKDFFWGAATAAHQVEGANRNCDWWEWEASGGGKEPSGDACQHYQYYEQDFDLAKTLNHNCHRFSIEWSRIQPAEDKFSEEALEHYRRVIRALRQRGIEPVITLHHFTSPLWFSRLGGWENKKSVEYFLRYAEYVVSRLAPEVRFWVTINEPMVYTYFSYIKGDWPPQVRSYVRAQKVKTNLAESHIRAFRLIHGLYRKNSLASPMVSIAHNMIAFVPCGKSFRDRLGAYLRNYLFNLCFIEKLIRHKSLDFIGINYYTRHLVDTRAWTRDELLVNVCGQGHDSLKKNSLGWEIYPQGLFQLLLSLRRYKLPVFILENGICAEDDTVRWEYIRGHLASVARAIAEGVNVMGYVYWSLMDNFEWDKGFAPRFGLIAVNYQNQERSVRESAKRFSRVCAAGRLDDENG